MTRKWFGIAGLILTAWVLMSLSSCARDQKLQGITITPQAVVYGAAVPAGVTQIPVQLTAYGSYIHPPETKDITTQVTWKTDIPNVGIIDSAGHLTAGPIAGSATCRLVSTPPGIRRGMWW